MSSTTKAEGAGGLSDKARAAVAAMLNHVLVEELALSTTTRSITGALPSFQSLHKLLADQSRQLGRWLERLATRTGVMGGEVDGAVAEAMRSPARLTVRPESVVADLLQIHEEMARRLREDVRKCSQQLGDPGTANLLERLVEFHETNAWILRMALEGADSAQS